MDELKSIGCVVKFKYANSLISRKILEVSAMTHNMTVTIEDELWKEMKAHSEIRWSAVMKEAAKDKLKALKILERLSENSNLSEREIETISVKLGKKISGRT